MLPYFLRKKIGLSAGFTMMEVLIAIFVFLVGIIGVVALLQQITVYAAVSSSKLTANYLSQEGLEIVRNIRDTNWLQSRTATSIAWDDGIPNPENNYQVDYTTTTLADTATEDCSPPQPPYNCQLYSGNGDFLKLNTDGFYNYSLGTNTKFKRKITISGKTDLTNPSDGTFDMFTVTVVVEWQDKGKTYQVSSKEYLYNWR